MGFLLLSLATHPTPSGSAFKPAPCSREHHATLIVSHMRPGLVTCCPPPALGGGGWRALKIDRALKQGDGGVKETEQQCVQGSGRKGLTVSGKFIQGPASTVLPWGEDTVPV